MKPEQLFAMAIGLQHPWFIDYIDFKMSKTSPERQELHIYLKHQPNTLFKSVDNKEYPVYDHVQRIWRHMDFFQHECYLHASVPRVKTDAGNTLQVAVPWAEAGSSFTLLFEALCMTLMHFGMNATQAGKMTRKDPRVMFRIVAFYVTKAMQTQPLEAVESLGIDETSTRKGHNYFTILTDMDRKKVVGVSIGKDGQAVQQGLKQMNQRGAEAKAVKQVVMDLSPAFTASALTYLPKAKIVYDRFHIEQLISKGVDEVRKLEQIESSLLRKTKYLWLRNQSSLTKNQNEKIHYLSLTFPALGQAYRLKEQFKEIWNTNTKEEALISLKEWMKIINEGTIQPLKNVVKTIRTHWSGIMAYFDSYLTSGFVERVNLKIQEIKRSAKGYRNPNNFRIMIFFHLGKLILPTIYG